MMQRSNFRNRIAYFLNKSLIAYFLIYTVTPELSPGIAFCSEAVGTAKLQVCKIRQDAHSAFYDRLAARQSA
ncbi:hypothetical protein [Ensifer sp. 4252]|uniref:hypothetical protein n=1 Tax=Ensifer sp. 4252 TaxID=3373915 RepID=UPI003D237A21